jgi:GxxExxY protein
MIDLENYNPLTKKIIGAAIEVYNVLGCGFLESVYQKSMEIELGLQKIPFIPQNPVDVFYKGNDVGHYIPDIIVFENIIVELKAQENINYDQIQMQIINYLVATGYEVALMINFGKLELETKRYLKPLKHQKKL